MLFHITGSLHRICWAGSAEIVFMEGTVPEGAGLIIIFQTGICIILSIVPDGRMYDNFTMRQR